MIKDAKGSYYLLVENTSCEIQFGKLSNRTQQEHPGTICEFFWSYHLHFLPFVGMQQIEVDSVSFPSVTEVTAYHKQMEATYEILKCFYSGYVLQCKNLCFSLYALTTYWTKHLKCATDPKKRTIPLSHASYLNHWEYFLVYFST